MLRKLGVAAPRPHAAAVVLMSPPNECTKLFSPLLASASKGSTRSSATLRLAKVVNIAEHRHELVIFAGSRLIVGLLIGIELSVSCTDRDHAWPKPRLLRSSEHDSLASRVGSPGVHEIGALRLAHARAIRGALETPISAGVSHAWAQRVSTRVHDESRRGHVPRNTQNRGLQRRSTASTTGSRSSPAASPPSVYARPPDLRGERA